MDPQRWAKIEALYNAALEKEPSERSEYLAQECAADSDLRREVETLLGYADAELKNPTTEAFLADLRQKDPQLHDQLERLLRAREDTVTIPAGANGASRQSHNPGVNDLIGPYRLLSVLGEGGIGIVYLAQQERPIQRRVALKLIKPGIASPNALARFESERQTLAMMDHPNIAHVYDAGATEAGQPYFVMEHVPGASITAYCDQHKLPNRERLKLFRSVCLAIHHAHQKGVIHQDIKPSNVLVTEQDGVPVPKVIDFGIAKAIEQHQAEQTLFTLQGVLAGTPEYMSPEQANLDARDVDASSDVYSLGVLLYELLVGTLPFDPKELRKKGLAEILRIIREDSFTPLSGRLGMLPTAHEIAQLRDTNPGALRRQLTGELNWITMRAMEKDRRRRYNSAAEFGSDIERYLNNEPVIASPPSRLYRLRKFTSKNRLMVVAAAAVLAALCVGFGASTVGFVRAERARAAAEARAIAREQEFLGLADQIKDALQKGDLGRTIGLSQNLMFSIMRRQRFVPTKPPTPQEKFARLKQQLPKRGNARFYALTDVGKAALAAGKLDEAEYYGNQMLAFAPKYRNDWNYGNAIFFGNMILGQVALRRGNIPQAKSFLLASGRTPGSTALNSTGPNMSLAKELVTIGERDAVVDFFALCGSFWKQPEQLDDWAAAVRSGGMPYFGNHLAWP